MQVRRSLFLSTADKLFSMVVRFGTLIVTARLMTPQEIGIAVLGTVVLGVAGVIREFGGAPYLIQADEVTPERVRTVFTAQFLFTLPLALIVFVCA
ncbi:MAG: oligosaccharide flippase family protein, partial [Hyphomonadaceae bacterium]|nr:oligosaccharide flippase family protein [Hyphomonadaceae bacterium]